MACEFCGDDDATVATCLQCITPSPYDVSSALCAVLGGDDWEDVGRAVAEYLGWGGDAA